MSSISLSSLTFYLENCHFDLIYKPLIFLTRAKALAQKNMRDLPAQKEQAEQNVNITVASKIIFES